MPAQTPIEFSGGDIIKSLLALFAAVFFCAALFLSGAVTATAVSSALSVCLDSFLPSLFPFMIIASFLSLSGAIRLICRPLYPVMRLLSLPKQTADLWVSSFIGGYPAGAACLCGLYDIGTVSRDDAERLLPCLVNPGPAFILLVVGQGVFGSVRLGAALLLSQAVTSLLLCALCGRNSEGSRDEPVSHPLPFDGAFVEAVSRSAAAMIDIFAFVIAFAVITGLLTAFFPFLSPLCMIFEVTLGCQSCGQFSNALYLAAFLIGFGGLSVCFQVLAISRRTGLVPKRFWSIRLLSGIINAVIARVIMLFLPGWAEICSVSFGSRPIASYSADRLLGGLCFCAMLLITMKKLEPNEG